MRMTMIPRKMRKIAKERLNNPCIDFKFWYNNKEPIKFSTMFEGFFIFLGYGGLK